MNEKLDAVGVGRCNINKRNLVLFDATKIKIWGGSCGQHLQIELAHAVEGVVQLGVDGLWRV